MIEPTETESKETLDAFADALLAIAQEDPELLHAAPVTTPISRPDEVAAAKRPILRWTPDSPARPSATEAPVAVPPADRGTLVSPSY